jgi:hypothetical protein
MKRQVGYVGGALVALLAGIAGLVVTSPAASAGRSPSWLNNGTLRATSIQNGGNARLVLDNVADAAPARSWNANTRDPAAFPQILEIDLRRTMMVSAVRAYRGNGDQPGKLNVYVAGDNGRGRPGVFTKVASPTASGWNFWLDVPFTPTRGRFIRFQFDNPVERFDLSEISVRASTRLTVTPTTVPSTTVAPPPTTVVSTTTVASTTSSVVPSTTVAATTTTAGTTTVAPTTTVAATTTTTAGPTTTVAPGPVSFTPAPAGTKVSIRQYLPPTGSTTATQSYGLWTPSVFDTCSKQLHDTYWVAGADNKIYATWHPAVDLDAVTGQQCTFGHEHGDDPRTSPHYATQGMPPFALTNQMLADTKPAASHRSETHEGHKVAVYRYLGSKDNTADGNNMATARPLPGVWCDVMMKYHHGTHSADALSNHLHEIQYHQKCTPGSDPGLWPGVPNGMEFHITLLSPLGKGGQFTNNCTTSYVVTQPALPADGPDSSPTGTIDGERNIPCSDSIRYPSSNTNLGDGLGPSQIGDIRELWTFGVHFKTPAGSGFFGPYAGVFNPARAFDANMPDKTVKTVDMCYANRIQAPKCTELKNLYPGGVAWNDPRSPYKGTERSIAPKANYLWNDGASNAVFYTDVYGRNPSYTAFAGSIKQYASATKGMVEGAMLDHNRPTTLGAGGFENLVVRSHNEPGIHAPN